MRFFKIVGGLILAVLAIGLAGAIYQTGFVAGAAGGANPAVVGPAYGYGWGWGWGFGGGLFHLLGFIFFIFLFFALLRVLFGGHRRGWGPGPRGWGQGWGPGDRGDHPGPNQFGPWEDRARQIHDEWHRRQDAPPAARPDAAPTDSGSGNAPTGGNPA
jgi:hypothetical protein